MDDQHYRENITIQYCFPDNNASCPKEVIEDPVYIIGYIILSFILSCISVCTVFLNLLVIISISHFKQLHTPTNLIILSLAVADFLVGLVHIPAIIYGQLESCWYLGPFICYICQTIGFVSKYGSLHSMVLIAVDRFIAITNPLQYSSQITLHKTLLSIILGWSYWLCYVIVYLYFNNFFTYSYCYGECIVYVYKYWVFIEFVAAFLVPCILIIILYSVIFKVAMHQAKAIRAVKNCASNNHGAKTSIASEIKAAKKLGTVVFVYLVCWIPNYIIPVLVYTPGSVWSVLIWILDMNSFMNPLMYAIFYSWFRTSAKYIVTCRIFKSSSSRLNLFPEH